MNTSFLLLLGKNVVDSTQTGLSLKKGLRVQSVVGIAVLGMCFTQM